MYVGMCIRAGVTAWACPTHLVAGGACARLHSPSANAGPPPPPSCLPTTTATHCHEQRAKKQADMTADLHTQADMADEELQDINMRITKMLVRTNGSQQREEKEVEEGGRGPICLRPSVCLQGSVFVSVFVYIFVYVYVFVFVYVCICLSLSPERGKRLQLLLQDYSRDRSHRSHRLRHSAIHHDHSAAAASTLASCSFIQHSSRGFRSSLRCGERAASRRQVVESEGNES
eukprot:GHVU01134305.1.p1 GENE.GHVU01134305.1~~GHVU01134305.1.p1  ORF type:complete len:231 (-),score=16.15 GHVU01134305.1:282-974(-)